MSFVFKEKPVAVIKAKSYNPITETYEQLAIPGVTTGTTTADNAAAKINALLEQVCGRTVTADETMTRTRIDETKEA